MSHNADVFQKTCMYCVQHFRQVHFQKQYLSMQPFWTLVFFMELNDQRVSVEN